MATSLERQLKKLETPQTSIQAVDREQVSILFNRKDACMYGRDTYFSIGQSGFEELLEINSEFLKFKDNLFGKANKDLQRAVLNQEANKKLDKTIEHFLLLLSPYLEKQAALKALEWLVNRFMIHMMNISPLMMCILPYYESSIFLRILQIIKIDVKTKLWSWMLGAQKSGVPLTKLTFATHWVHSQAFRSFLVEYLQKMDKIHKNEGNMKKAIALYNSTVMGGLCLLQQIKEEHVLYVVKSLPLCLRSSRRELVAGMYIIIAQLAVKTKLSHDLIHNIINLMIDDTAPLEGLEDGCVRCLLVLLHHQGITALNHDAVKAIQGRPELLGVVEELAKTKSVASILSAYTRGYVSWICEDDTIQDKGEKLSQLLKLQGAVPLSSSDAAKVIWSLFEVIEEHSSTALAVGSDLATALDDLEKSHPEGYSSALAQLITWDEQKPSKDKCKSIIRKILNIKTSSGSNFIQLVHPDDKIRLAAVENFTKRVNDGLEKNEDLIKMQMDNMLSDECPAVVAKALELEKGLTLLETSYCIERCQDLLERIDNHPEKWQGVQVPCIKVLCQTLVPKYQKATMMSVLYTCLPIVLFPKEHDADAIKVILKSPLAKGSPLLAAFALEISPLMKNTKSFNPEHHIRKMSGVVPEAIGHLTKGEQGALWAYVGTEVDSPDTMRRFVSLVLLRSSLLNPNTHAPLLLKLAHRFMDAVLHELNNNIEVDVVHKGSRDGSNELMGAVKAVRHGKLSLPFLSKCLKEVVKTVTLPAACSSTKFWTPALEENAEEGNLLLLLKTLKSAVQLERFGGLGNKLRNQLVTLIMKDTLETREMQYYFLAMVWGWHTALGFLDIVDDSLQAWSLGLGGALLAAQCDSMSWALGTGEPVVPGLITALISGTSLLRSGALTCLKHLMKVKGAGLIPDNYTSLLKLLLQHDEELLADESHLSKVLRGVGDETTTQTVVGLVLGVVSNADVPIHLKVSLLYMLSNTNNTDVLTKLLPLGSSIFKKIDALKPDCRLDDGSSFALYYILLHFTANTTSVLDSTAGWDLFAKATHCSAQVLSLQQQVVSPQSILMDQVMSRKFFTSIGSASVQSRLWSIIISRVAESDDPQEAALLRRGLRKVTLDADVIIAQIQGLDLFTKVTTIKAAQAKRLRQKGTENRANELVTWKKLGLMLESIGVMAGLARPWVLVGPLCQCLQETFTRDLVITELVQQQLLSALLHLMQSSVAQLNEDVCDKMQLNVELVVQCIRSSVSPDTHRRAMLVLALAAKISPDLVMHNMMAIFTFMGTSLLRRDDAYSFQVIHQTIQSIVPALIKAERKQVNLSQVCQVFVDALPDLPEHRRMPLFTQLADTIDVNRNLWMLLALICDAHVMRGVSSDPVVAREDEKRRIPSDVQFAISLVGQFPGITQTTACTCLMDYIVNLPEDIEEGTKYCSEDDIINRKGYTSRQLCHFKYTCVGLMSHLLASETFVGQVCKEMEGPNAGLEEQYQMLLEKTMCYLRAVTELTDNNKDKPAGKFWSALQRKVIDVVDGVNAVLPPHMLLRVVQGLIKSPLPVVRCRAMELLCAKLQPSANFFSQEDVKPLLKLVGLLREVGAQLNTAPEIRQTALYALQLLTRFLASNIPGNVANQILETGVHLLNDEASPDKVITQALLIVAEAVIILKAKCVPHLARIVPTIIKVLNEKDDADYMILAVVATIQKLVETIPKLLSPYLRNLVCAVCRTCATKEELSKESRVTMKLAAVRDLFPKFIEARVLIPCLSESYSTLVESDMAAVQQLFIMAEGVITNIDTAAVGAHTTALLDMFSKAMDIRTIKGDTENIGELENTLCSTLVRLLLRLNEHDNLAIFNAIKRWALDEVVTKPVRLITLYRFADLLAGKLKVLFIKAKLADSIYTHAVELLERNNSSIHDTTLFGSGDDAEQKSSELTNVILDTLTKVYTYDSVNFVTQERFKLMVKPLIAQLDNKLGGHEAYKERITNHFVECVVKCTSAVADDTLWRELNREILVRARREDDPLVVLGALETYQGLVEALGEDYLQPLLPDTMPAITEILESNDDEVEAATKKLYNKMESILGDNLRAYLND